MENETQKTVKLKKSNYSLVREIFTENLSNHDTHVSDVQANIFYYKVASLQKHYVDGKTAFLIKGNENLEKFIILTKQKKIFIFFILIFYIYYVSLTFNKLVFYVTKRFPLSGIKPFTRS